MEAVSAGGISVAVNLEGVVGSQRACLLHSLLSWLLQGLLWLVD